MILNPTSRNGRAASVFQGMRPKLKELLGDFDLHVTREPGDAQVRVARALEERSHSQILVAGGDGTINEAVNGWFDPEGRLRSDDIPLGVVDIGTGGDFFRSLKELAPAYSAALRENRFRMVDCGELSMADGQVRRFFVNIASIGMGAGVLRSMKSSRWSLGGASFYLHTLRTLVGYRPRTFQVRLLQADGSILQFEQKLFNLFVCNARYSGGGMNWAPEADLEDGVFDVLLLSKGSKLRLVADTGKVYRGEPGRVQGARLYRAEKIELEVPLGEVPELDGEVLEARRGIRRYEFTNRRASLPLVL